MSKPAVTREDIDDYDLPPDFTKASDSRQAAFVEKWGDIAVELDALPVGVLRNRITSSIEAHMDIEALRETRAREGSERVDIREIFSEV